MKRTAIMLAAILAVGIYGTADGKIPKSLTNKVNQALGQSNQALKTTAKFSNAVDKIDKQGGANAQSIDAVATHLNGTDAQVARLNGAPQQVKATFPIAVSAATVEHAADCPAGTRLTGGGYELAGEPSNVKLLASIGDGSRWLVRLTNPAGPPGQITVQAICLP